MTTLTKKSKQHLVDEYIAKYNPFETTQGLGYNIAKIARYAKEKQCNISQLSQEEIEKFRVSK